MHLAHPLMQRALAVLARRRYPGDSQVSRWTVRRGGLPTGMEGAIVLSVEELAVNELRETFHNPVRRVAFDLNGDVLGDPAPADWPLLEDSADSQPTADDMAHGASLLEDAQRHLRDWLHTPPPNLAHESFARSVACGWRVRETPGGCPLPPASRRDFRADRALHHRQAHRRDRATGRAPPPGPTLRRGRTNRRDRTFQGRKGSRAAPPQAPLGGTAGPAGTRTPARAGWPAPQTLRARRRGASVSGSSRSAVEVWRSHCGASAYNPRRTRS